MQVGSSDQAKRNSCSARCCVAAFLVFLHISVPEWQLPSVLDGLDFSFVLENDEQQGWLSTSKALASKTISQAVNQLLFAASGRELFLPTQFHQNFDCELWKFPRFDQLLHGSSSRHKQPKCKAVTFWDSTSKGQNPEIDLPCLRLTYIAKTRSCILIYVASQDLSTKSSLPVAGDLTFSISKLSKERVNAHFAAKFLTFASRSFVLSCSAFRLRTVLRGPSLPLPYTASCKCIVDL